MQRMRWEHCKTTSIHATDYCYLQCDHFHNRTFDQLWLLRIHDNNIIISSVPRHIQIETGHSSTARLIGGESIGRHEIFLSGKHKKKFTTMYPSLGLIHVLLYSRNSGEKIVIFNLILISIRLLFSSISTYTSYLFDIEIHFIDH